ncbi:hypothetical protein V8C86DRAFT_3036618 [Haematococcus lacustris]
MGGTQAAAGALGVQGGLGGAGGGLGGGGRGEGDVFASCQRQLVVLLGALQRGHGPAAAAAVGVVWGDAWQRGLSAPDEVLEGLLAVAGCAITRAPPGLQPRLIAEQVDRLTNSSQGLASFRLQPAPRLMFLLTQSRLLSHALMLLAASPAGGSAWGHGLATPGGMGGSAGGELYSPALGVRSTARLGEGEEEGAAAGPWRCRLALAAALGDLLLLAPDRFVGEGGEEAMALTWVARLMEDPAPAARCGAAEVACACLLGGWGRHRCVFADVMQPVLASALAPPDTPGGRGRGRGQAGRQAGAGAQEEGRRGAVEGAVELLTCCICHSRQLEVEALGFMLGCAAQALTQQWFSSQGGDLPLLLATSSLWLPPSLPLLLEEAGGQLGPAKAAAAAAVTHALGQQEQGRWLEADGGDNQPPTSAMLVCCLVVRHSAALTCALLLAGPQAPPADPAPPGLQALALLTALAPGGHPVATKPGQAKAGEQVTPASGEPSTNSCVRALLRRHFPDCLAAVLLDPSGTGAAILDALHAVFGASEVDVLLSAQLPAVAAHMVLLAAYPADAADNEADAAWQLAAATARGARRDEGVASQGGVAGTPGRGSGLGGRRLELALGDSQGFGASPMLSGRSGWGAGGLSPEARRGRQPQGRASGGGQAAGMGQPGGEQQGGAAPRAEGEIALGAPAADTAAPEPPFMPGLFRFLSGADVSLLLLAVHRHLGAARHPSHRLQRLAPLRVLLAMLGWRMAEPRPAGRAG